MHNTILNQIRLALLGGLVAIGLTLGNQTEPAKVTLTPPETTVEITHHAETTTMPSEPTETSASTEADTPQTEPVEATEPPTEPTYTAEELEMLALVIYQEAGADFCSDETRLMVGTVVMNRIADPRFPDTMYDVVTEERAYGELHWTGIVWPGRASHPTEAHAVDRAYAIAERILLGERTLPADVIFQSEYIMGEIVAHSDGLYFCR
jgi:hypothetical protein